MGATVSQLWAPEPIAIGFIGLRSAGKTMIVHKLSGNQEPAMPSVESESPFPTSGSHHTDINSCRDQSCVPGKPTVQTLRLRWKPSLEALLEKFHVQAPRRRVCY